MLTTELWKFLEVLGYKGVKDFDASVTFIFFLVWKFERQLVNITLPYMLHPC